MIKLIDKGRVPDGINKGYHRLAAGILTQAFKDWFDAKELEVQLDCLYFLAGPDAKLYAESWGMQHDPLQPICDGKAEFKERIKGMHRL